MRRAILKSISAMSVILFSSSTLARGGERFGGGHEGFREYGDRPEMHNFRENQPYHNQQLKHNPERAAPEHNLEHNPAQSKPNEFNRNDPNHNELNRNGLNRDINGNNINKNNFNNNTINYSNNNYYGSWNGWGWNSWVPYAYTQTILPLVFMAPLIWTSYNDNFYNNASSNTNSNTNNKANNNKPAASSISNVPNTNTIITMKVQEELTRLGYYNGTVDGNVGPRTQAAIIKYQQANSLPVTGQPDAATLQKMGINLNAIQNSPD